MALYSFLFQFLNLNHLGAEDTCLIVYILQAVNAKLITISSSPPKDILKDFQMYTFFFKRPSLIYVSAIDLCAAFCSLQSESGKQGTFSASQCLNVFIDI